MNTISQTEDQQFTARVRDLIADMTGDRRDPADVNRDLLAHALPFMPTATRGGTVNRITGFPLATKTPGRGTTWHTGRAAVVRQPASHHPAFTALRALLPDSTWRIGGCSAWVLALPIAEALDLAVGEFARAAWTN